MEALTAQKGELFCSRIREHLLILESRLGLWLYLPSTLSFVAERWAPTSRCTFQCGREHCLLFSSVSTQSTNPERKMIIWYHPLATLSIIEVMAYGKLLDRTRWSQTKRAWISFACWLIPQAACFIWIGIEYAKFGRRKLENALDYETYAPPWPCIFSCTDY